MSIFDLIAAETEYESEADLLYFLDLIKKLYKYRHFKQILDFILTRAFAKEIEFKLPTKRKIEITDGLCETLSVPVYDKVLNKIFRKHHFVITITKLSADVIIHEFAHAAEKASNLDIKAGFLPAIDYDLKRRNSSNMLLLQHLEQIFVRDLAIYQEKKRGEEIFARYFEIFAASRNIATKVRFDIKEVEKFFEHSRIWVIQILNPRLEILIDIVIANETEKFVEDDIESLAGPSWKEKITSAPKGKKWGEQNKSIFDD